MTFIAKHGMAGTRLYRAWTNMRNRCNRKADKEYKHYGGRGIKVCEEWQNDFETFKEWALSNGYDDKLTLDRIDTNGNYEPNNCRWITRKEQNNNMTSNVVLTVTHNLTEWSEITGISYPTLQGRIRRGWKVDDILFKPIKKAYSHPKYAEQEPKTQMVDKSNFDVEQYKMDLQCAYDCGKASVKQSGDAVSRQAVLDAINRISLGQTDAVKVSMMTEEYVKQLPSVQPKQKTGRCRTCKYGEVYNDLWCKCHDPLTDGIMVEISDNCIAEEVIEANRRYKERTKNEHPQRLQTVRNR